MSRRPEAPLSRREREILDIVYAKGAATAREVRDALADPPSYSAVRGLVRVLEDKGHLVHRREGVRNVYHPTRAHDAAGRSAMKRALDTFFFGDVRSAVRALLEVAPEGLDERDAARIAALIDAARAEGR